jgi:predicted RNA-binding protein with EMAP domain
MMKREKEELLKSILEDSKKSINFSENAKSRFLERISSDDEKIKQLVYAYLSCQSIKEQEVFLDTVPSKYLETFTRSLQEIATWYPSNVPYAV